MAVPAGGPAGGPKEGRELRQCALAVSVMHELDLVPADAGVVLPGIADTLVAWSECDQALAGADPASDLARRRLARWLRCRGWVAERSLDELAETCRPVGLPRDHALHAGDAWTLQPVLGGSLDLGVGFVGLDRSDLDGVVVVPPGVLAATGVDVEPWWPDAVDYLENMGAMAAARWRRNPRVPLRPMGDCDVVTLLGSALFRGAVVADAGGLRAVAAPMRRRGWFELSRIDPAFVLAAAAATDEEERGFPRPVLLTADEVAMVPEGGRPAEIVLRDPAPATGWLRDVLYH